jgi:hypothetical protein
MADQREEDLSELGDADAVLEKIRSLMDDGWQPTTLTLVQDEGAKAGDPEDDEGRILRDDPKF